MVIVILIQASKIITINAPNCLLIQVEFTSSPFPRMEEMFISQVFKDNLMHSLYCHKLTVQTGI